MSGFLGKLSWDALPYDPIVITTLCVVAVVGAIVAFLVIKNNLLGVLWRLVDFG